MCEREETEREDEQVNNREGSLAGGGEMVRSRSSQFRPRQKNKIIKRKRKGKGKGKKKVEAGLARTQCSKRRTQARLIDDLNLLSILQ